MLRKLTALLLPLALLLTGSLQAKTDFGPGPAMESHDFEVEDFHTYFVGESGVWVHNTGRTCEDIFEVWTHLLEHHEGNLGRAYQRLMRLTPDMDQVTREKVVWGMVDQGGELDQLFAAGKLDNHVRHLGSEAGGFNPREAFAGARFEFQKGKTLSRGPAGGADFIEQLPGGGTRDWDAKGPFPAQYYKWEGTGGVKASIDKHYLDHGVNKDESVVIDLAGLKKSDADTIIEYLKQKDPNKELYEILLDE